MSQRPKALLQPAHQRIAGLPLKLHRLHVFVHGGYEFFHLFIGLIGHGVIDEHHRAVFRQILQKVDELPPLHLVQLENVPVRHRDHGALRHHGHGLHGVRHLLRRDAAAGEAMEVEVLAALGDQQLLQLLHIGLAQVALLPVKQVGARRRMLLYGLAQALICGVLALFRCHS